MTDVPTGSKVSGVRLQLIQRPSDDHRQDQVHHRAEEDHAADHQHLPEMRLEVTQYAFDQPPVGVLAVVFFGVQAVHNETHYEPPPAANCPIGDSNVP